MMSERKKTPILLVDDEQDIRDVLYLALTDLEYEVLKAENGSTALGIFKAHNPPIVMTDIKMPVMDGITLLKRIKSDNPETEVIMITGHGDMDLAIKSLKNEATDFITKPINVEALEVSLKRARERIQVREQLKQYTRNLETLVKEKIELQDRLSSLGLMIGTISHGVKGLLTGLDSGIYLVDSGMNKGDDQRIAEGWDTVKLMVGRIKNLIQDILYYAKERRMNPEEIDVVQFASQVCKAIENRATARGCVLETEFPDTCGCILIDTGHFHAALMNILENAVDACAKDTEKPDHTISFKVSEENDHVIFCIEDNGIGMDEETREKLFTLFFSSKGREGTGLGLFNANKIIEQHGGTIQVKSRPGKGSCFTVRVPKGGWGGEDAASDEVRTGEG